MEIQINFKKFKSSVDGLKYSERHVETSWNCWPASKSIASEDWEWISFDVCIRPIRPLNMVEAGNKVVFESDEESSQDIYSYDQDDLKKYAGEIEFKKESDLESDEDYREIYSDYEDDQETDDEEEMEMEIEDVSEEKYESESYSSRRAPKFCRRCSAVINCSCMFARKEFESPFSTFIKQRQKIKNVCAFCSKDYPILRDSTDKLPLFTEKPDTNTPEYTTEYVFLDRTKE
ncbi:hypothetical protein TIFTF001_025624 [Ficus carica]|uniref:Uncharacterized protein n=1 Tax=Ficus carica TaxID=3494 RepID=A0AA88AN74_FICCA|nr:hypothetical protein TIFTF001_025624 [Ficus carica]